MIRRWGRWAGPLAGGILGAGFAWGLMQAGKPPAGLPRQLACPKVPQGPTVDGHLDDPVWAKAAWSEPFLDIEGDAKPKPTLETRVKAVFDEQAVYFAVKLEEPHLQGTFTEHDSYIFHNDNDFEVFLDPDGDCHEYGELEMNALNTTWDLLLTRPYRDGGRALDSWEIKGLKTAVALDGTINNPADTDKGWTIEIKIPWKSLAELGGGSPPKINDRWRINFSRVQWEWDIKDGKYVKKPGRPERNWVWSPQGEINMHMPERWGSLVFVNAEDGHKPLPPDRLGPVRWYLGTVHKEMLERREKKGTFATNEAKGQVLKGLAEWPRATQTTLKDLYECRLAHGDGTAVSIRHDGKLTETPPPKK